MDGERSDGAAIRHDRAIIAAAAAALRTTTITDQHAGLTHPVRSFHVALLLDELARHAATLPPTVRTVITEQCQVISQLADSGGCSSS